MKWSIRLPIVLWIFIAIVWANPSLGWARRARYSQLAIAAPFQNPKSKTCKDAKAVKGRVIGGAVQLSDSLPVDSALSTAGFKTVGQVFDAWYLKNVIPSMTHADKLGQLARTRAELLDDLSRLGPGPARSALVKNLLKYAWGFGGSKSSSKFHPALRVNAMLLLGEMNQTEESRSGDRHPPVPHAIARRQLLKAWESPNQPSSVRVAILVGLGRHVMLDRVQPARSKMSAEDRDAITTAMLTLLDTDEPHGDINSDGLVWMRRQAMEILGNLPLKGAPQEQFTQSLVGVLADEKNSLSFRCAAAATLGKVTLPESHKADVTAQALARLALDATAADLAELDQIILESERGGRRGGGEMYGGGAMPGGEMFGEGMMGGEEMYGEGMYGGEEMYGEGMFGGEEGFGGQRGRRKPKKPKPVIQIADERTVPTRRQLLHHLISVRSGLLGDGDGNGGLISATGTDRDYVDSVATELVTLIKAAKDVTTDLEDFHLALTNGSEELVALLGESDQATPVESPPAETYDDLPDFEGFE